MKRRIALSLLLLMFLCCASALFAQATAPAQSSAPSAPSEAQQKNMQEYIELLRSDVRQQKSQIMGSMMQLTPEQASKFWPIYSEYDRELTNLNNLRVANVQEYARSYENMTAPKADELMQKAIDYRRQRTELLAKYYGQVKAALGAIQAARFLQVESQLLEIIDLQIESSLPVASQPNATKGE